MISSCTSTKKLQKSLWRNSGPIGFYSNEISDKSPRSDTVFVKLNQTVLPRTTNVYEDRRKVLPLIFFNRFESNKHVMLGESSIDEMYNEFFLRSLLKVNDKRGRYLISKERIPNDSALSLEIDFDKCQTIANYRCRAHVIYLLLYISSSHYDCGFPAETQLMVTARLKRGRTPIFEKKYFYEVKEPYQDTEHKFSEKEVNRFTNNMVTSLSKASKKCIEDIIDDMNSTIHNLKKRPITSAMPR